MAAGAPWRRPAAAASLVLLLGAGVLATSVAAAADGEGGEERAVVDGEVTAQVRFWRGVCRQGDCARPHNRR